jgi:hypothetical protein
MKKYNLNLKENEELIVDCDDLMETELAKFKETIKDLSEEDVKVFANWVKVYKLLNYDIIDGLTIEKVYKFNEYSAVIELTFRGNKEYDLLNLNPETMTVSCMNVKNESVRPYVVRRLLLPDTVEDALSFAKSQLPREGIESVGITISEIQTKGEKYNVTEQIKLYDPEFIINKKEPETQTIPEAEEPEIKETEKPKDTNIEQPKFQNVKQYDNSFKPHNRISIMEQARREDGTLDMRKYTMLLSQIRA